MFEAFFRSVIRKFAPRSGYFPRAGQSHPLPPSLGKETRWRWTSSPPLRLLLFRGAQGGILSAVAVTRAERSSWNLTQMLFFLPSLPRFHFNEIPCPDGIVSRLFFSFPFFSLSLFPIARDTLKGLVRGSPLSSPSQVPLNQNLVVKKKKEKSFFFSRRFSFDDSFLPFASLVFETRTLNARKVNGENSAHSSPCKTFQYSPSVNRNILWSTLERVKVKRG